MPPPTSIRTLAVVAPSLTSTTLPLMTLRALSRMLVSLGWPAASLCPARRRDREPRARSEADRLEMAGDPAVRGAHVHVHVRLPRGEDAAMVARVEPDQLDRGPRER